MKRIPAIAPLVLVILLCVPAALRADDATYPIKLTRPDKVGQKLKIEGHASVELKSAVTANGQTRPGMAFSLAVAYQGQIEILEVDKDGQATKEAYTFTSFKISTAKGSSEPLGTDNVVLSEFKDGKWRYTLKNGALTEDITKAMDLAFGWDTGGDETFGTDKSCKVGESWGASAAGMAEDLKKYGLACDATKTGGKAKLAGIKTVGGVKCLEINATFEGQVFDLHNGPTGATLDKASAKATVGGLYPVDQGLPPAEESKSLEFEMQFSTKPAGNAPATKIAFSGKESFAECATLVR